MYKLIKNIAGQVFGVCIEQNGVLLSIPFDPDNSDAQEFCKWLKAGNIPEAADGGTTLTQAEIDAIIAKLS